MRRPAAIVALVLGALAVFAIPSSALARSDCTYTGSQDQAVTVPVGSATVTVYADATGSDAGTTGTADAAAGACADNVAPAAGFDGGLAEAGAGDDPGAGTVVTDGYAVVDGSDANSDPSGQGDGYIGLSNYETGAARDANCSADGPDQGEAGTSNSGGCVGLDGGPWVDLTAVPAPTPMCGNTSGNGWDGSGNVGSHTRDGCSVP